MMPCAVQTFGPDQAGDARRRLREALGTIHHTDLGGVPHLALKGRLDPAAYAEEEQDLEAFLDRADAPRVLLDVREFEGWQSPSALTRHLALVHRHDAASDKWQFRATEFGRRWPSACWGSCGALKGGSFRPTRRSKPGRG
jgi:hypothetical protein